MRVLDPPRDAMEGGVEIAKIEFSRAYASLRYSSDVDKPDGAYSSAEKVSRNGTGDCYVPNAALSLATNGGSRIGRKIPPIFYRACASSTPLTRQNLSCENSL